MRKKADTFEDNLRAMFKNQDIDNTITLAQNANGKMLLSFSVSDSICSEIIYLISNDRVIQII